MGNSSLDLKVWHLMVLVAVSSVALLILQGIWSVVATVVYGPYGFGLSSSLLSPGQAMVVCEEFHAPPASRVIRRTGRIGYKSEMYEAQWRVPTGEYPVSAGTPCVVTIDPAPDEDDCAERRPIAVKIRGGPHLGLEVAVPRRVLRRR